MGGCLRTRRHDSPRTASSRMVSVGKNQRLKPEKPRWKSEIPLTNGQLRSKRDEFWDTAPAFEGRKEIWDALRAAAQTLENGDHELAQAIIDGASITLPNGTLLDCYDELGNRYQLPVYVLSLPTNMAEELSDESEHAEDEVPPEDLGPEIVVKFRLSHNNHDVKLHLHASDSVLKIKKLLFEQEGVEPLCQRWFFGGRLITDKMTFELAKIQKGCLVQVIVSEHMDGRV